MRIIKIFIILGIILLISLCFLILNKNLTGHSINKYSYTKAICNEKNFCQDYEIYCNNGKLENLKPISGAVIQNSDSWKDPRDKETIENFCK
ncbi:hypothetical protein DRN73_04980 [Candidatus Pacearchaeota archaeon]|nr:MAG: hypothetical protein DRN73_04980 [Candidatus Pacearchaeota archaeon]